MNICSHQKRLRAKSSTTKLIALIDNRENDLKVFLQLTLISHNYDVYHAGCLQCSVALWVGIRAFVSPDTMEILIVLYQCDITLDITGDI